MTTSQEAMNERVEGFKPTLYELQVVGRNAQETGVTITQQLPNESKDLGPLVGKGVVIGSTEGVNDASARTVEGIALTVRELQEVAAHYYDEINSIKFFWDWSGQTSGCEFRKCAFSTERLSAIRTVLGKRRFEEAIAADKREWYRKWDELEEKEKNLAPCKKCGGKRTIRDETNSPRGWCCKCENGFSEEEFAKRCEQVFGLDESGDV
jgi:hypothetical protein